jgi:hypothetical protein
MINSSKKKQNELKVLILLAQCEHCKSIQRRNFEIKYTEFLLWLIVQTLLEVTERIEFNWTSRNDFRFPDISNKNKMICIYKMRTE